MTEKCKVNPDNHTELWFGDDEGCDVGADFYYRAEAEGARLAAFTAVAVSSHEEIVNAALAVVDNWETRDLAASVRELDRLLTKWGYGDPDDTSGGNDEP